MITQKQRDAYRFALEDKGVPPVIAFMAARNLRWWPIPVDMHSASDLMLWCFTWLETPEGFDFWNAVDLEAS